MLTLSKHHENRYTAFDGKLYLERRPRISPYWQVRTSFQSRQKTETTKHTDINEAAKFAEKWFLGIRYRLTHGETIETRYTMTRGYRDFMTWQRGLIVTQQSSERKCKRYADTWNVIKDFFGERSVQSISTALLEEFRTWRLERAKRVLSAKTIHSDYILVRLVLKRAAVNGHLKQLPVFPTLQLKHSSPDWFNQKEYRRLIATSKKRCNAARKRNRHHYFERMELHAFILMVAHSCIRVDECLNLRWMDCTVPKENELLPKKKRTVLLRLPDGKVGPRTAMGMFGAVAALKHLRELHPNYKPSDRLFSKNHYQGFAKLLEAADDGSGSGRTLRLDSQGRKRNQKTLRHTSIMMRHLYEEWTTIELSRLSGAAPDTLNNYYMRHLQTEQIQRKYINKAMAEIKKEVAAHGG